MFLRSYSTWVGIIYWTETAHLYVDFWRIESRWHRWRRWQICFAWWYKLCKINNIARPIPLSSNLINTHIHQKVKIQIKSLICFRGLNLRNNIRNAMSFKINYLSQKHMGIVIIFRITKNRVIIVLTYSFLLNALKCNRMCLHMSCPSILKRPFLLTLFLFSQLTKLVISAIVFPVVEICLYFHLNSVQCYGSSLHHYNYLWGIGCVYASS